VEVRCVPRIAAFWNSIQNLLHFRKLVNIQSSRIETVKGPLARNFPWRSILISLYDTIVMLIQCRLKRTYGCNCVEPIGTASVGSAQEVHLDDFASLPRSTAWDVSREHFRTSGLLSFGGFADLDTLAGEWATWQLLHTFLVRIVGNSPKTGVKSGQKMPSCPLTGQPAKSG
jgi:hypothetical protein